MELSNFGFIFLFNLLPELNYFTSLEPRMLQASVFVVQVPLTKFLEFQLIPSYSDLMLHLDLNAPDHLHSPTDAVVNFAHHLLGFQMFLFKSEQLEHYSTHYHCQIALNFYYFELFNLPINWRHYYFEIMVAATMVACHT